MKQTTSLSEFSRLSEYTRLYPNFCFISSEITITTLYHLLNILSYEPVTALTVALLTITTLKADWCSLTMNIYYIPLDKSVCNSKIVFL